MKIKANAKSLAAAKWYEYAVRFAIGGAITAAAGLIAKAYGPKVGGLFLAFPAIFPLTTTLIDKHEKERKQHAGMNGHKRARKVVAVDAAGATLGGFALLAFAIVVSLLLRNTGAPAALCVATLAWAVVAFSLWWISELF